MDAKTSANYHSVLGPKQDILLQLLSQYQPRTYIEVGCYQCVTLRLVQSLAPVYGIGRCIGFDLFEPSTGEATIEGVGDEYAPLDGPPVTYEEAIGYGLEVYKGDSRDTLQTLSDLRCEEPVFAFIDGGHSFETCYSDIRAVKSCHPGAVLLVDDTDYPGVAKAIMKSGYSEKTFPYHLSLVI